MNGQQRIAAAFANGRRCFMPYVVLGHPTPEASLELIGCLADAGADLIELGVPFSDPLADGPAIQAATQRALENGMSVVRCLELVARARAGGLRIPVLLMGYINPILAYGVPRFVADADLAGVDGLIIPDLPPEEASMLEAECQTKGLALVHFVAVTTPTDRAAWIAARSQGFVYLISVAGVTGMRQSLPPDLADFLARVRSVTDRPLAVGFGISTPEQAMAVARVADGVIVGSALVSAAESSVAAAVELGRELAQAIHAVR